jgi:hypothetical protein
MGVSIERCTERASHAPKSRRTVNSVDNRAEVREFLISRRAKVTPQQAGVADIGARRVPGLRRGEVAALAGVSVEYYSKLERGAIAGVSASVLDASPGPCSSTTPNGPTCSTWPTPPTAPAPTCDPDAATPIWPGKMVEG